MNKESLPIVRIIVRMHDKLPCEYNIDKMYNDRVGRLFIVGLGLSTSPVH